MRAPRVAVERLYVGQPDSLKRRPTLQLELAQLNFVMLVVSTTGQAGYLCFQ